jgi:hypothetical protein
LNWTGRPRHIPQDVPEAILATPIHLRAVPPVSTGILLDLHETVLNDGRFAQQASGVYGIVNFFPLLLNSLGITGDVPLVLYGECCHGCFAE